MTSPPSNWRSILLIRHGATALNSDDPTKDRIRGCSDWPLSEHGKREALLLAEEIAYYDITPKILLTSDLLRAQETAVIIANALDIELELPPTMDFRPWDVGNFVGTNAAEAIPVLAQYAITGYERVPGGESFNQFRGRFFNGLVKALHRHGGLIGIVTHHRCERLLKAWAKAEFPENGSINFDEFTLKGDPTGHCEIIKVPVHRLELWMAWWKLHNPVDFEVFTR